MKGASMKKFSLMFALAFLLSGGLNAQDSSRVPVVTGLENLLLHHTNRLKGQVLALVTDQTGIDHDGVPNYQRLLELEDVELKVIFTADQAFFDEISAKDTIVNDSSLNVFPLVINLKTGTVKPAPEMLAGVTLIVYDIQDGGVRYSTAIATLGRVLEAAGELDIPVLVLDRPNPLGGTAVEGPLLRPRFRSFVGYYPLPIRHGMTMGELALMIVGEEWVDPLPKVDVLPLQGWKREMLFDETGLPWVKPSPNIPDLETALVYPGTRLLEGTNISVGHGTRQPYKMFGSPWSTFDVGKELNIMHIPGVVFRPAKFTPKTINGMSENPRFKNKVCLGMKVKLTDPKAYRSVRTGVRILYVMSALESGMFKIKPDPLSKLWGTPELVQLLTGRTDLRTVFKHLDKDETTFRKQREKYLLY
jgi:uncharacterized protein YbbC (DUF1343 family)